MSSYTRTFACERIEDVSKSNARSQSRGVPTTVANGNDDTSESVVCWLKYCLPRKALAEIKSDTHRCERRMIFFARMPITIFTERALCILCRKSDVFMRLCLVSLLKGHSYGCSLNDGRPTVYGISWVGIFQFRPHRVGGVVVLADLLQSAHRGLRRDAVVHAGGSSISFGGGGLSG